MLQSLCAGRVRRSGPTGLRQVADGALPAAVLGHRLLLPLQGHQDCGQGKVVVSVHFVVRLFRLFYIHADTSDIGKIQGDGRKFLDRFKSYFGSQISSQSLNEIHICRLQPKSATKGEFFSYIFVFDCQFESAHVAL